MDANDTTVASLQSTLYYIEDYVILLRPIVTFQYHMLVKLKLLKVLHPSNMLQERMNIQNILAMRFQSTIALREMTFRWIYISRQYPQQSGR